MIRSITQIFNQPHQIGGVPLGYGNVARYRGGASAGGHRHLDRCNHRPGYQGGRTAAHRRCINIFPHIAAHRQGESILKFSSGEILDNAPGSQGLFQVSRSHSGGAL